MKESLQSVQQLKDAALLSQYERSNLSIGTFSSEQVSSQDVTFFTAVLSTPKNTLQKFAEKDTVADNIVKALSELQERKQAALDDMKAASKAKDEEDMVVSTRSLSSFYLKNLLAIKVVGKSVQSLEKLTNLQ